MTKTIDPTTEARDYLVSIFKPEYTFYIKNSLAGDFAVKMAAEHKRLSAQLCAELKYRNDNCGD